MMYQNYLVNNPCYKSGKTIPIKGITLHSVGCAQPKAQAFIDYWGQPTAKVCVHAIIDGLTGDVHQTLPWNMRAWHCGAGSKGSYNDNHISVEMCEPDCIKYLYGATFTCSNKKRAREIAKRTYKAAVKLFAELCDKFNLDPLGDGVIVSHSEAHARGYASGHADPEHLWNQLGLNYNMDKFRKAVKKAMKNFPKSYVVKITRKSLKVRDGAGIIYKVTNKVYQNETYTIVEEKNGWGKLISGAGWIKLKYTEKI